MTYFSSTSETERALDLEEEFDYGWSEYTPGTGWQLQVKCFIDTGRTPYYTEFVDDSIPFINELCQFAAALSS